MHSFINAVDWNESIQIASQSIIGYGQTAANKRFVHVELGQRDTPS